MTEIENKNTMESESKKDTVKSSKTSLKDNYKFNPGAIMLIFYQFISGMGAYCFILTMPIYMHQILKFTEVESTIIYHSKNALSHFLNIIGSIIADSFLGRAKTYFIFMPIDVISMICISIFSIFVFTHAIIAFYFVLAIAGGIASPAMRAFISDQIPQDKPKRLSAYMHIIYFVNNLGVIIVAFVAPILHKDIYCFGMECYPLVFFVSLILTSIAFGIFIFGYCRKLFIIFEATNNLLINIYKCLFLALKRRIQNGKPEKNKSFLDYAEPEYTPDFIKDIKIALGLIMFLFAHPLFWMVFEQMSSIWTLQATSMNGRISDSFVIKADQVQTLNPILVVILIPLFEVTIYPLFDKINFKMPYRIMSGQFFTALACLSLIFIQDSIQKSYDLKIPENIIEYRFYNLQNNTSILYKNQTYPLHIGEVTKLQFSKSQSILQYEKYTIVDSQSSYIKNVMYTEKNLVAAVVYKGKIYEEEINPMKNGGYTHVRSIELLDNQKHSLKLEGTTGINKNFLIESGQFAFSNYVECAIGKFKLLYLSDSTDPKYYNDIVLYPAQTLTLILAPDFKSQVDLYTFIENNYQLISIAWQIIPYILVTIGEVLFNVNTGIFIYGEAPLSMKSMMLAGQYVCIAIGNILILILSKSLDQIPPKYLFVLCCILVGLSGIATGIMGYFYLKRKAKWNTQPDMELNTSEVTNL